jgi:hypothetical protein
MVTIKQACPLIVSVTKPRRQFICMALCCLRQRISTLTRFLNQICPIETKRLGDQGFTVPSAHIGTKGLSIFKKNAYTFNYIL